MSTSEVTENLSRERISEILGKSFLFMDIDPEDLSLVTKRFSTIHLEKDEPLFVKGEVSQFVYFVISGNVEIILHAEEGGKLTQLKVIRKGESISELSVLTRSNHSTSCFALEDTYLLKLDADSFYGIMKELKVLSNNIIKKLSRLNQQITNASNFIEYYRDGLFQYSQKMRKFVPSQWINEYQVLPLNIAGNVLTIAMLDITDKLFYQKFFTKFPHIILKSCFIKERDYKFLEKKIKYNYKNMVESDNNVEEEQETTFEDYKLKELLDHSAFFGDLKEATKKKLIPYFKEVSFKTGSNVFRPNAKSETFYIIKEGLIELHKNAPSGAHLHICTLGPKDCMGEISLVTESTHSLFARAVHDTKLYSLDKKVFNKLLNISDFTLSLTSALASRLQMLNNRDHIRYFTDKIVVEDVCGADLLPLEIVSEYKIITLKKDEQRITLGLVNPESDSTYAIITRYLSDYQIDLTVIDEDMLEQGEKILYKYHDKNKKFSPLIDIVSEKDKKAIIPSDVGAVDYLKVVIQKGDQNRASDIHFEPGKHYMTVRYRIDGELFELSERLDLEYGIQMINKIKVMSEMDITEKRFPQDGQMVLEISEVKYTSRVSTIPTLYGEKVVLRLVKSKKSIIPLKALASDRSTIKFLQKVIQYKQGVFLVTGPTGSGKTTSLYSMINELNSIKRNIITVEDPVEINLSGLTQVEIKEEIDLTYEIILRNLLRQDPDVIMIGEIRDKESAAIAFEAALTGHLVLSSLHANTTFDVIPRLHELGVDNSSIASGLIGVMSQRLLPALCTECKTKEKITNHEIKLFKKYYKDLEVPEMLYHPKGCNSCFDRGIYARLPVFEYWLTNESIRNALLNKADTEDLKRIIRQSDFQSLSEYGATLAKAGFITFDIVNEYLFGMD